MFHSTLLLSLLSLPLVAFAAPIFSFPSPPRVTTVAFAPIIPTTTPAQSLGGVLPVFPAGQTAVVLPAGQKLVQMVVGRGTQNYTCGAAGTYISAGAVADLYDISPYASLPSYAQFIAPFFLKTVPFPRTLTSAFATPAAPVARHFFIANGTTIAPEFEFRESTRDVNKFTVGSKVGTLEDPVDATKNVAWLQFTSLQGSLAKTFFRHNTAGGQPPLTCNPAKETAVLAVPYSALYSFFY